MDIEFYNQLNLLDVFFDEKRNPKDGGYCPGPDGKEKFGRRPREAVLGIELCGGIDGAVFAVAQSISCRPVPQREKFDNWLCVNSWGRLESGMLG